MFCSVQSAMIRGVDAVPVTVEADVSDGMPQFTIVGFVSSQVREAQDRVRTAIRNLGIALPPRRITINLAPGDLRKDGTRFDLPIAAAVLQAIGVLPQDCFRDALLIGELHLDGTTERITGVLPSVLMARAQGCRTCLIPYGNVREGRIVEGIRILGVRSLEELVHSCGSGDEIGAGASGSQRPETMPDKVRTTMAQTAHVQNDEKAATEARENGVDAAVDFADILGQDAVKRAALISAAGFHNLLLSGPPGSGKSMAARRIPTILPELTKEEQLEISRIYSIAGLLPEKEPLLRHRPFRAPHHAITSAALCGGGFHAMPGEITLAHRGVLFLDELAEMEKSTLELLRQPLEDRKITIARMGGMYTYPASFLLVAATNLCPCGYYPDRRRCSCSVHEIRRYRAKLSQALLDRIDLWCEVPAAQYSDLTGERKPGLSSAQMQQQVARVAAAQADRYKNEGILFNSEMHASMLKRFCSMSREAKGILEAAFRRLGLSARGYHRVLRVARTIADLEGVEMISETHISEALCFRCKDDLRMETGTGAAYVR